MIVTAEIAPFRAYIYNQTKIRDWNKVLTPPYDVISREHQQLYYDLHPNNVIRVDYGLVQPKKDKYEEAAKILDNWIDQRILIQDKKPGIYVMEHEFLDHEGRRRVRRGFVCLLRIEKFGSGKVLPHEKTFSKHKKDRLMLLRATGVHCNPIFTFFPDPEGRAQELLAAAVQETPRANFHFEDGATNRMWAVHKKKFIAALQDAVAESPVFIADGHHRYETSLNFRREMQKKLGKLPKDHPARYTLVYCCASEDPGLEVTSPHRLLKDIPGFSEKAVLKRLSKFFNIESTDRNCAIEDVHDQENIHRFALQTGTKFHCLTLKNSPAVKKEMAGITPELAELDVTICRHLIIRTMLKDSGKLLNHIAYDVDPVSVSKKVESGEYQVAVYLPPFNMEQLMNAVEAKEVLPHKSTYFYPKLVTGLAIYRINVK